MTPTNRSHNVLLAATAILSGLLALAFLFATNATLNVYGLGCNDAAAIVFVRLLGTAALTFTVLAALARRVEDVDARRAIDTAFLAGFGSATIVAAWAQSTRTTFSAVGWATVALYAAYSIAFAIFVTRDWRATMPARAKPMA